MSRRLPSRLRSVANMVPHGAVVVDIGCDHGLLSATLAKQCKHVFATDISPQALSGTYSTIKESKLEDVVTILEGFGLDPILERDAKVDTAIMAGMGLNTISKILCGSEERLERKLYRLKDQLVINEEIINAANIDRIIVQPWPPYLLAYIGLIQSFYNHGWTLEDQAIERDGKAHYITSCFIKLKRNPDCFNVDFKKAQTMSQIFEGLPLSRQYRSKPTCIVWKSYLKQQIIYITSRLEGFEKTKDKASIVDSDEIVELQDLLTALKVMNNLSATRS